MKKLRLYIETSVRNFLFADDATEKRAVTELLFHETESGNIFFVISEIVVNVINRAPIEKPELLVAVASI